MAVTGGIDLLQRNIVGQNHTMIDMGPIIAQRGDLVSVGNGSAATGAQSVCVGYNAKDNGSDHSTIIGPGNFSQSEEGVIVGYANDVRSDHVVALGAQLTHTGGGDRGLMAGSILSTDGGQFTINMGFVNTILADCENVYLIGVQLKSGVNWTEVVGIGTGLTADTVADLSESVFVGHSITVLGSRTSRGIIAIGKTLDIGSAVGTIEEAIVIGQRLALGSSSNETVLVGFGWTLLAGNQQAVLIGTRVTNTGSLEKSTILGNNLDLEAAGFSVVLGSNMDLATCDLSVIIGSYVNLSDANGSHIIISAGDVGAPATVGAGASRAKLIGSTGCAIGGFCERAILIGEESKIAQAAVNGSADVIIIGNLSRSPDRSNEVSIFGYNIDLLNPLSSHTTLIGDNITVGGGVGVVANEFCSVLGTTVTVDNGNDQVGLVGYDIHVGSASNASFLAGATITVGSGCGNSIVIGSDLIHSATSPRSISMGYSNILSGGSNNTVFVASSSSTTGALVRSVLLGNQILWDSGNDNVVLGSIITMHFACNSSVVIGSNITYNVGGSTQLAICASSAANPAVIGTASTNVIMIGTGAMHVGANSENCAIVGQGTQIAIAGVLGSPEVVAVGNLIDIGDGADGTVVVGSNAGAVAGAIWSTVIGYGAHSNGQAGIAIGAGAVAPSRYCVIGNSNDAYYLTNLQVMGDDAAPFFEVYGNIPLARVGLDVGMKVWDGAVFSQVSSAAVPPVGARLLYIL